MSQAKCPCESFERLEGASVPAYTKAYLEEMKEEDASGGNRLRCRVCGRAWERRTAAHEGARPSLVRLD
jgi:hypothetical protein